MINDELPNLLKHADASLAQRPPALTSVALVTATRRRTRAWRRKLASSAILVVAATIAALTQSTEPRERQQQTAQVPIAAPRFNAAELRAQIAQLQREAAWRTEVAKSAQLAMTAMLATTAASREADELAAGPALDDAEWLRVESARSAALSWHYANLAEHQFRDLAAARREYERLIQQFPGTTWAQRSQVSLDRILTSHKTPL